MRLILSLITATALTVVAGCAADARYNGTVTATAYTPDLVTISPGVQVIADYNEPVFYSDNYYWRYNNGWYRSSYYDRGWVSARPTVTVGRISQPHRYVHYRPAGYVARRHRR